MYDLHIHSLLSDGVLLPSEICRRYEEKGYQIIAITDHCDYSNIKNNVNSIIEFCRRWPKKSRIKVLSGAELTHLPLGQFRPLVKYCRKQGIKIIVGHGESPVEPVTKGTNKAAILAGVDILAHPGKISKDDVLLARENGVFLELTARRGHCAGNIHLVKITRGADGAGLVINNDAHAPEDIIGPDRLRRIAISAGLDNDDVSRIYLNEKKFLENLI